MLDVHLGHYMVCAFGLQYFYKSHKFTCDKHVHVPLPLLLLICVRNLLLSGKGKDHPITGREGQRGSIGIALLFLQPRHSMGWVVSATSWLVYPWERPSTHCIGAWLGPRACLDGCGESCPHWDLTPGSSRL
jgi:hypothetical protein